MACQHWVLRPGSPPDLFGSITLHHQLRYPRLPWSGIPVRRGSSARTFDPDALGRFLQTKKTGSVLVPTDLMWSLCSGADPFPVRVMAPVSIRHSRPVSPAAGINDPPGLNPTLYLRFRSSCEIDDIGRGWSRNRLARGGCSLSAWDCLVKNRKLWFFITELSRGLAALRFLLLYFEFPTQLPRPSECTKLGRITVTCSDKKKTLQNFLTVKLSSVCVFALE